VEREDDVEAAEPPRNRGVEVVLEELETAARAGACRLAARHLEHSLGDVGEERRRAREVAKEPQGPASGAAPRVEDPHAFAVAGPVEERAAEELVEDAVGEVPVGAVGDRVVDARAPVEVGADGRAPLRGIEARPGRGGPVLRGHGAARIAPARGRPA
jgi:hypothetical protein